jgi:4-hydroxythreonine-4-phosphate dehydrogenase
MQTPMQNSDANTNAKLPPLAITMGDASGIGPEIVLKALADNPNETAIIYGDINILQREVRLLSHPPHLQVIEHESQARLEPGNIPVIPCSALPPNLAYAKIDSRAGAAAFHAIERATIAVQQKRCAALVTAPIHKEALAAGGVPYPGHTEMLSALSHDVPVRMMLANHELRTVLVTIHQSLRSAIESITFESVLSTIVITHESLLKLGISAPRIAVAALNPHAGEGGIFGHEEQDVIAPAITAAKNRGINVTGPHPGDTVFTQARKFARFDVVVAMYHDQGLIPVKYLGFEQGVNITLGLPFVRTSPDHGTAFDIAGQGIADPRSLIQAMRMARELTKIDNKTQSISAL